MVDVTRIAVIGSGTMGRGIAQSAAAAGYDVALHDVSAELLERARAGIAADLDRAVSKGKGTLDEKDATLSRIGLEPSLEGAAGSADLVLEAVPENLDLKRDLFVRLDAAAAEHAVLATNTSSLPVGRIAEAAARPERVVGMHFFNPVPLMPLLEVVRAARTSDGAVETALEPIVVRDSPGFATSRLGVLLGIEAMRMLEEGVASAEDIDKAMTLGYRHPMGPLRLTDLVGLDVRLAIAEHLHRELRSEAFRPPEILRRMVAENRLGQKTGRGFYKW